MIALPVVLAFALTWCALRILPGTRLGQQLLDRPNERSLHVRPVPRIGGIGILAGMVAAWAALPATSPALDAAALGYAVLAVGSWLDDRFSLPVAARLPLHLGVAAGWAGLAGVPFAWIAPAALAIGWTTNLYNFMDGADGLAGSMAVIGFGTCGAAAWLAGDPPLALMCAAAAAAAAAFLCFNFPPATMFLGDAGSVPLGFLAGAVGVLGWRAGHWPWAFPLLAFFPFLFDATFTLVRRALRGQAVWRAHREHLYQAVVLAGLSHRQMTLRAAALMAVCAAGAWASLFAPAWAGGLIMLGFAVAGLLLAARVLRPSPPGSCSTP
jgi:UDP-N-acetylmuramyl pentapeptide phosphotransferase/UDP-N-acetylglucosamine-1-phosphate transferase